jgi:hypothetical protein
MKAAVVAHIPKNPLLLLRNSALNSHMVVMKIGLS